MSFKIYDEGFTDSNNLVQPHSLDRSYESGFKGLKQIWNSLKVRKVKNRGDILSRYTSAFLDRTGFHNWWSR